MIDGDTPLPSRCLVFADVAGSTRLYERLGDKAALRVVDLCLKLAAAASTAYQGEVVKTIGDEIMVAFPSAEQGLLAACDMQQRIAAVRPIAGQPLAIRVGCQWGPVVAEDGDYFGDT
ncbi:MAG: adenylate/guanylate cyclase domain-containing protein, partial [Rhodocyclaceae bacterium]